MAEFMALKIIGFHEQFKNQRIYQEITHEIDIAFIIYIYIYMGCHPSH